LAVQLSRRETAYAAFVGRADPRESHETAPKPHATGYLDEKQLARWLPQSRDVDVYFLGPVAFMRAVKKHLRAIGVPESQSRYEFFGPACALE